MPVPTNNSRPSLPYVPVQSLPNNTRLQLLTTTQRPPTAEMLDAEFNALTDDVNMLADAINVVVAGTIPGSSDILNANKLVKTDGAGNLSFTYVTNAEIAPGAVVEAGIAAQAVTTSKIGNGAVTTEKMAPNAITSGKIAAGGVIAGNLANDSVIAGNIAAGGVITASIANLAVTRDKLVDWAVGTNQIGDVCVTAPKMAPLAVTADKIADNAVTMSKLAIEVLDSFLPIGSIIEYAGSTAPPNSFLECNGQAVSRVTYATLFASIGVVFGAGDGSTTFNLPDRRGRVAVGIGADNSTGGMVTSATASSIVLGGTFGVEQYQLTVPELPSHSHIIHGSTTLGGGFFPSMNSAGAIADQNTSQTGSNQPHNNTQPSIFMRCYIRAL